MKENNYNYFKIWDQVLEDNRLTLSDKIIYCIVDNLTSLKGFCWASNRALAMKTNLDEKTIQRSINRLIKKHYLSKWKQKKGKIVYRILTTNKYMYDFEKTNEELKKIQVRKITDYDWLNER